MKNYIVNIQFSHESFGGYDHIDGVSGYTVWSRNEESAKKKAMKIAKSEGGGYHREVKSVFEHPAPELRITAP